MPDLNATITAATATFVTHDDDKDTDTSISVYVDNRISLFLAQAVAKAEGVDGNTTFQDNPSSTHTVPLNLGSTNIAIGQLQVPTYLVRMHPTGNDRWIFDLNIELTASDGTVISGKRSGIILDQNNREAAGVLGF